MLNIFKIISCIYMTPTSKVKGNILISGGVESPSETPMFCISKTSSLNYYNNIQGDNAT